MNPLVKRSLSVMLASASLFAISISSADEGATNSSHSDNFSLLFDSRVKVGFEINPVPLQLRGRNVLLVGLGSYLVNAAGGCNDCHTNPSFAEGGNPFLGETEIINTARYLAGGRPFGPTLRSANITPHANGRPAGLTFPEFEHLLRTGREENGEILQVMPWNVYGKLTQRDLRAIYEYLRSIPSLPDSTP